MQSKNLKKNDFFQPDQIRQEGGGRKSIIQTKDNIEAVFLQAIEGYIAGDPMNEKIRWLKLTRAEISEKMKLLGINVSRNIVRKLMKKQDFVKRKMQRKRSIGKSVNREEQFNNIVREKEKYMSSNNPVISIDTKKKENIGGNLHRDGSVYCTQALEAADHDYSHLADLKIAPHGIYDMKQNKAYINIGVS
jgi:DDE family transposase